jgi:hypothetical protein
LSRPSNDGTYFRRWIMQELTLGFLAIKYRQEL